MPIANTQGFPASLPAATCTAFDGSCRQCAQRTGELSLERITLCVVDDSASFRAATKNDLATLPDLEVIEAATADTALALCSARAPKLVLVNLRMPSMHGLDFIRRLNYANPGIKIIVTSSHDAAYRRAALTLGAHGFIAKSRLAVGLAEAIRGLIASGSLRNALTTPMSEETACRRR